MGTNYYMITKNKELAYELTNGRYELTDTPDWGYRIHVAKCSAGWLPLFQAYTNGARSIKDYKEVYDKGDSIIVDEYGSTFTWEQFDKEVLKHNGGKLGVIKPQRAKRGRDVYCRDSQMPYYVPVSHLPGTKQSYRYDYTKLNDWELQFTIFADPEGYEFDTKEFC
jgi:hypothetical protein